MQTLRTRVGRDDTETFNEVSDGLVQPLLLPRSRSSISLDDQAVVRISIGLVNIRHSA
jgi:hypothetical protein